MKRLNTICTVLGVALLLHSCDDFLNKMPDSRAELNSQDKVVSILVSAYPDKNTGLMSEFGTDNMMDNGAQYSVTYKSQEDVYLWRNITSESNDDPKYVWQSHYISIAAANQALKAIQEMGDPSNLAPYKAEALMCRAYSMFSLANVFCQRYNPQTADRDLGLPYPETPETMVDVKYKRGTMAELYAQINKDIEAALPNITDDAYKVSKYHFNKKAAYAFATRFNLFYVKTDQSNYGKVIQYANVVLGTNPASLLRDYEKYMALGATDLGNAYVSAAEPANLLLIPAYSILGRSFGSSSSRRFNHNREICTAETYWAAGPWGSNGSSGFLILGRKLYGINEAVRFPNVTEFFEYTDKTGGSGYAHIVSVPFTTNETLLCRAEAYALKGDYDKAVADMDLWQKSHCLDSYVANGTTNTLQTLTRSKVNDFFTRIEYAVVPSTTAKERTIKKKLHPQGFTVAEGEQENFIQCLLHFRRLETLCTGQRWYDIKRYGIEVGHNIDGQTPDVLKTDDLRRAIQLPSDVISAGMEPNPR